MNKKAKLLIRLDKTSLHCLRSHVIVATVALISILSAAPARAVIDLQTGDKAPSFELADLDGNWVDSSKLTGKTVVVIFGELYHTRTLWACDRLAEILKDQRLANENIDSYLVIAQAAPIEELKKQAQSVKPPIRPLHDPARQVYEAYRVAVMPSVVVIDGKGLIVHTQAGVSTRFEDILLDSLLVAVGKLSLEDFKKSLHPQEKKPVNENQLRAQRLSRLADQLASRTMDDLAREKYQQAIDLAPNLPEPHIGLGHLMIKDQRLAEAEFQYRAALAVDQNNVDARLGLAFVQTLRGGDELTAAQQTVQALLIQRPNYARAHYLLGLIREKKGEIESACESFKKAAELLLESSTTETSK